MDLLGMNGGSEYGICGGIAPRCDLLEEGKKPFGAVDAKTTDDRWNQVMIRSGPT